MRSSLRNSLRKLREAAGLTQEKLARSLDVTRQTVISIESGKYDPSLPLAIKIARKFGRRVEDIFRLG